MIVYGTSRGLATSLSHNELKIELIYLAIYGPPAHPHIVDFQDAIDYQVVSFGELSSSQKSRPGAQASNHRNFGKER
jgi:hypothetical protein